MPDTLLQRKAPDDLPEPLRAAWQRSMTLRGDATLFEVFGHHPGLYQWYSNAFYGQLFRAGLVEQPLKELLRLRLSELHGCRFCNQGNRPDSLAAGISQEQLDSIGQYETGPFSERERAVLRLADQISLTEPQGRLDRSLYKTLTAHFAEAEILELGMLAGLLSGMAKFMFAFDLVEREATCPFNPTDKSPAEESEP